MLFVEQLNVSVLSLGDLYDVYEVRMQAYFLVQLLIIYNLTPEPKGEIEIVQQTKLPYTGLLLKIFVGTGFGRK